MHPPELVLQAQNQLKRPIWQRILVNVLIALIPVIGTIPVLYSCYNAYKTGGRYGLFPTTAAEKQIESAAEVVNDEILPNIKPE